MSEIKEIKHFVLPNQTKDLYTKEALSSISLTQLVAEKLNEIIDRYNLVSSKYIEKELEQDGRINKGIIYMKDNLSNTLNDIFETMRSNGELDEIINESLNTSINELSNTVITPGDVRFYGAKGNGLDETILFKNASDTAKRLNIPFIVPAGVYKISTDLDLRGIKDVQIDGEIVTDNDSVVIIGSDSTNGNGIKVNIKRAKSIKVVGVKNSLINIDYCETLHLFANGDDPTMSSIAYTQFYGAYAKEIIIDSIGTSDNIGWINENIFRIKRVEKLYVDGNYAHNNNHFEHINFERGEVSFINARNNYISARCEGGVTINNGSEVNHNFIEKEYYYKHYFGEDVIENEKGVVTYFPVNKLQVEKELMLIDKNNKEFPVGSLLFKQNGSFNGVTYNEIFHSNLIKIDKTFSLKLITDAKAFRVQLKFYDENKNLITSEVDNFSDGKMKYNGASANWTYSITANTDLDTINFYPGVAKYVEYSVIFGNAVESIDVTYAKVKLLKYINTDVYISNELKSNVYTQVPVSGYWEQGQILYGKNPIPGANIGIICTQSGTPGVWKNFGPIQE